MTQFVYWKTRIDPLFKVIDQAVPKSGAVLDLGCGYGIAAHWLTLASPPRTVLGVDNDADKLRVARATAAYNPRVTFEEQDVLAWAYPPADCVLLLDLLHYLPHALKARVLAKAFAALPPGGCLVLRDAFHEPTRKYRLTAWSEQWGVRLGQNKTAHGLHFETLAAYQALLQEAGFAEPRVLAGSGLGSNCLLLAHKP